MLKIYEVNKAKSTFAGTYIVNRSSDDIAEYPLRGQYDPKGLSIGWVVSYWTAFGYENQNSLEAWAGEVWNTGGDYSTVWSLVTRSVISYEDTNNTVTGDDQFDMHPY